MTPYLDICLSNRLETLYQKLKFSLFSDTTQLLKRRIVVVYGPVMKSWLMLKMAQDPELNVAFGIEFLYLNQAFDKFTKIFMSDSGKHLPTPMELAIAIEAIIYQTFLHHQELSVEEKNHWLPLFSYLKMDISSSYPLSSLSTKIEKRIASLSEQLGLYFQEYGKYGPDLIEELSSKEKGGWQGALWKKLFEDKLPWTYPIRALEGELKTNHHCEIHLFSISFLSRSEFDFITRLGSKNKVYCYQLSPCAVFWSDIKSDKERASVQRHWQKKLGMNSPQVLQLEELLRERNPLLANFGRLGREMATTIEEIASQSQTYYQIKTSALPTMSELVDEENILLEQTDQPMTLLQAVQTDMLLMRNPEEHPLIDLSHLDFSIQLHKTPSKRREVEILFQNLLRIMKERPDIVPSDVIVMAPQIVDYEPYIRMIFEGESNSLDYQILDLGRRTQSELVQGFFDLIELSTSRWDANELLRLFRNKYFQKKHHLNAKEYEQIKEWVQQTRIYWGINRKHRNHLLAQDHCRDELVEDSSTGTWEQGVNRLLMGMAAISSPIQLMNSIHPFEGVEFSQAGLLEKLIGIVQGLHDDLSPLYDRTQMTLLDWSNYLNCLLESYFETDVDDEETFEDWTEIQSQLELFKKSARWIKGAVYGFHSVLLHLRTLFQDRGIIFREQHLQSVRFCSLMPMRSIPAKVIALLGMQEGTFPRVQDKSSLNLLSNRTDSLYHPSSMDHDRYLFLEAIHSARDYLLVSYQSYSQQDNQELQPSLVIQELFSYLNQNYSILGKKIDEICVFHHPLDSFAPSYFEEGSRWTPFSLREFQLAQVVSHVDKKLPHAFIRHFSSKKQSDECIAHTEDVIDIKSLTAIVKNPIQYYLRKQLNIKIQSMDDRDIKQEEDLKVSCLDKHQFERMGLKIPFEIAIQQFEQEGKLPLGVFKTIEKVQLKTQMDKLHGSFKELGVDPHALFDVEFSTHCKEPRRVSASLLYLPAPHIFLNDSQSVRIKGKVEHVSLKGLCVLKEATIEKAWAIWPQFILMHFIPDIEKKLLFIQDGKIKESFLDDPETTLKTLISYYHHSQQKCSPLMPEWLSPILSGDAKGLNDQMKKLFSEVTFGYRSPELQWIFNPDQLPDADQLIHEWQPQASLLAEEMHQHWFKKGKKR